MIKGIAILVGGLLAFVGAQWGIYDYRDQADKRAEAYVAAHLSDYRSGDLLRQRDHYLDQSRLQRAQLYAVHYGGFILACWGASMLRRKRQTA
jgi:hypothetical protein